MFFFADFPAGKNWKNWAQLSTGSQGSSLKSVVDAKTLAAKESQAAPGFCARVGQWSIFDMK